MVTRGDTSDVLTISKFKTKASIEQFESTSININTVLLCIMFKDYFGLNYLGVTYLVATGTLV